MKRPAFFNARATAFMAAAILVPVNLSASSTQASAPEAQQEPLQEQHESAYVTDPSRWGQFVADPDILERWSEQSPDHAALSELIVQFHQHWLQREDDQISPLLSEDSSRIMDDEFAYGREAVIAMIKGESRGERPEGYPSSLQLTLRDLELQLEGDMATAFYRLDIRGGARWEFADLATVLQVFRKRDEQWKLVAQVQSLALDDASAPTVPDNVPNRIAPIRFDFVYPAADIDRAVEFYTPLLGPPVVHNKERAAFRFADAFFELSAAPIDKRIVIKPGMANGYAVVDVESTDAFRKRLNEAGAINLAEAQCGNTSCLIAEDPSGNVSVFRESARTSLRKEGESPPSMVLSVEDKSFDEHPGAIEVMRAWASDDEQASRQWLNETTLWVDTRGVARGADAIATLPSQHRNQWETGEELTNRLSISDARVRRVGDSTLITFQASLEAPVHPRHSSTLLVTQLWRDPGDGATLETMFTVDIEPYRDVPVGSMDYTAYPVVNLGLAGRYYKTLFGSEPYRDDNWFGFWSTTSVFGLVGKYPDVESYSPVAHRSNGYADFSIRSAEEVYEYLKSRNASFRHVNGINDQPGIDPQPGYRQILAVDSEGNLVNFSQYLEY
ncbi:MAG: nuclear transport factor 2 family protein [Pseudomonadota bacterium]